MGAGIARTLQNKYNLRSEFLSYRAGVGMAVALWRDNRYIVNLITKERFFHKPTNADLHQTLLALREFLLENDIHEVSAPAISTGLDQTPLPIVSTIIQQVFSQDRNFVFNMYHM